MVHIQAWLTHVALPYAGMLPTTSTHGTATVGATVVGGIDGGVARVGARVCVGTAEGALVAGAEVIGANVGRGVVGAEAAARAASSAALAMHWSVLPSPVA